MRPDAPEVTEWRALLESFLKTHPKVRPPAGFDIGAMAQDLAKTESYFIHTRRPLGERLTEIQAAALMEQIAQASDKLRAVLDELRRAPGNFRHLAEVIAGWAEDQSEEGEDGQLTAIADDAEYFLECSQTHAGIIATQARVLRDQYQAGYRHSRPLTSIMPDAIPAKKWLIGEHLPMIYLRHFGKKLSVTHRQTKGAQEICRGPGIDFIRMMLDRVRVPGRKDDALSDESIRSYVHPRKARSTSGGGVKGAPKI